MNAFVAVAVCRQAPVHLVPSGKPDTDVFSCRLPAILVRWALCLWALSTGGCSTEQVADLAAAPLDIIPEQFESGGRRWVRKELPDESDQRCLRRFFSQNPDLAGSGDLEGIPAVFSSGRTARRFYWIQAGITDPAWVCVSCVQGRFAVTDGRGSPFDGAATQDAGSPTSATQTDD